MSKCVVIRPNDFVRHHVGEERSSCFYFEPFALDAMVMAHGRSLTAHPARIEVSDQDAPLHKHAGVTIAFITAGQGVFRSPDGAVRVGTNDIIIVPPFTPHLSVADTGTTMIEHVVYLGAYSDNQGSIPS